MSNLTTTGGSDRHFAIALGIVVLLMAALVSHHPVASGVSQAERLSSIMNQGAMDQAVHGSLMAALSCLWAGMARLSIRMNLARLDVLLALIAYSTAVICGVCAMTFDGFVLPWMAKQCQFTDTVCVAGLEGGFRLASAVVQSFTRLALYMMAGSILLWSARMISTSKLRDMVGWVGLASGLIQTFLLATAIDRLTPSTLLGVLMVQFAWYAAVAWRFYAGTNSGEATVAA